AGSGFVTYTVQPKSGLATGTEISAQARVLTDTSAPEDTATLVHHIDCAAPTTTLSASPLHAGSADYRVEWSAVDEAGGSGVKDVTVYVAEDGADFRIWLRHTSETSAVYQGT